MVHELQTERERWIRERYQIGNHIVNYFNNLYTTKEINNFVLLNELFLKCISSQENKDLCKTPNPTEIRAAL